MYRISVTCALLIANAAMPMSSAFANQVDFVRDVQPILQTHCYSCHGQETQKSGLRLDIKSEAFKGGDGWGESIIRGDSGESPLIEMVRSSDADSRMPPDGDPLSDSQIDLLVRWVEQGAEWPDGVDSAKLEDRMDHWSLKPVTAPPLPEVQQQDWPLSDLDRFVLAKLEQNGLKPSPPADPITWLRRVTLDLTGLPPTINEVAQFLKHAKDGDAAYAAVVDRLLQSPRYGERWAQHWLDVVRYADTHGFEVNTERPNAWPYRDYVIDALNRDTPYDQFIKQQIAGDASGHDAATGFLVTASVLLPGQIGKDAPSIRLARQDALDEIVNNIGQTFLGLSVGCARCHDHKFDPITAKDYYEMQAFVAGVEYSDREVQSPETEARKRSVVALRKRLSTIEQKLTQFVPTAMPAQTPQADSMVANAQQNIESFPPVESKFVRFTIHDSNLHPSLGLIEPCLDEFEILTDEENPINVALASLGTKVTASGSRSSAKHKLEHVNDGRYGNARSWMSDSNGTGWVQFELADPVRIAQVVWSRDRDGKLADRLPIAYTLESGLSLDQMQPLVHVQPRRPPVQPSLNIDRFTPVPAKRLRFTVMSTNNLEPCIDELEVFNADGNNIALASVGTKVTTSGDTVVADRHDPQFVNDGTYGNSRSWMSNESGKGWVELQFADEQEITRVLWGRDRKGKFSDRLATSYKIEVANDDSTDKWMVVADSTDRHDWKPDADRRPTYSLAGLSPDDSRTAQKLLEQKQSTEARIAQAERAKLAFAGTFRKPDDIHRLSRGDPEQPKEPVTPAVLSALGDLTLPADTEEQDRRIALADWIIQPDNPMTARVMANRIWQWHFGVGPVETPNDFGRNGAEPTHPELLDSLAIKFIESGWSIKRMNRMIVLSATYRQQSAHQPEAAAKDADVKLLWRYPSRRLDAEAIRDGMLAVNGQLNLTMGGRGFSLFNKRGGLSGFTPVESFQRDGLRRMVYAHKVRRETDAVFGAFDCPDGGQSAAKRSESTTPIQALNLFNSRFTIEQAAAFARLLRQQAGDDHEQQLRAAYQIALNRDPEADELADAVPIVHQYGLETFCRALFNSNEFLFLP
ncbi:DUF1553 domain-containing protein [Rubripirellula lacrimiformis]|nr:DUF1553 domain-containing protein [Rubripirellula lacrimiformis]